MKNYKLKHLSKFCCRPANELEFEAVKMAAEIGGVVVWDSETMKEFDLEFPYVKLANSDMDLMTYDHTDGKTEISVLEFINKLRMTEEEAEKLEDDRVELGHSIGLVWEWSTDYKSIKALNGHYFKTNEDGTEVTLHKRD